jgi:EAL domain-containing protein (putative c-di-GMP-specific phosphodiesterase class I)
VRPLRERDEDLRGLGIEITETDAMQDVEQSLGVLAEFREAGVQIGLDDFGTGYSSLAHLKRLPLDVVKIDRSFVAGLPSGGPDEAIVDAVVGIGRRFGFRVIAEGVESAEQLAWLERAGCDLAQGYRLARPMPAAAFEGWLAERATAAANAAEC